MLKNWLIGTLVVALAATLVPTDADAKRLGGGKNSGMQRDMPSRTAPDAPAGKPATPAQGSTTPGTPAAAPAAAGATAAAGAAAASKKSWLGPIAGIAAAVGLVALMSHLGLGEAFANFLMLALLAVAVIALVLFIRRKMAAGKSAMSPAMAGGAGNVPPTQVAWPNAGSTSERTALNPAPASTGATGGAFSGIPMPPESTSEPAAEAAKPAAPKAFVPAAFDSEGFARIAKMIFIRLQAANDAKNLDDLRQFTTPEMFAALKMDLLDRGDATQETEVKKVDAQVLDVSSEAGQQIVSVRFTGTVVEERGGPEVAFGEVWHLVKPEDDSRSWAIAGIEQSQ
jgi:predicted lipid-binding transport protein (Tim44 family)